MNINSLTHYTKGTLSQTTQAHLLQLLIGVRFQVCFTPFITVLFTFPSRYLFTIGHAVVFRLGGWSPHVQTGLLVSRPTRGLLGFLPVRGYHPVSRVFPNTSSFYQTTTGLFHFRSPLLAESRLISFPPVTEMFQFSGFASLPLLIRIQH